MVMKVPDSRLRRREEMSRIPMLAVLAGVATVTAFGLYGCPERYEEPVGEIGEQLHDDLEAAGETIEEAAEDAVERIDEAAEDAVEEIDARVDDLGSDNAGHEQESEEPEN